MQYWMLQIFLTSREKPPLIDALSPSRITRKDYLAQTFTGEISFVYRKRLYIYRGYSQDGDIIAAAIGRERTVVIKPEKDFHEEPVTDWETANVFINLAGGESGQRIAMQRTGHIRNPLEVFRALTDHINQRDPDTDWIIATNPVSQENEFWAAVEQYRGKLTELDLTYIPPNIWGGREATSTALKKLHEETNNDQVEIRVRNADGKLNLLGELIRESVTYVTRGGGKAVLKSGPRKIFDTDSAVVTASPEEDVEVEGAPTSKLRTLIASLFP